MIRAITESVYFGIFSTIGAFYLGLIISRRFKSALANPLLIAEVTLIVGILIVGIRFEDYNKGAQYISALLNVATVCLAIPLYEQLTHLKHNWKAIMAGILGGIISSGLSILAMSIFFSLTHEQYVTLLPKSITAAIGIGVSQDLGGIPTITVATIIVTGLFGNVVGEKILHIFRIHHPIAKGVALGSSAHGMGTARALEIGELEGAISSLSLAVSGLVTVIAASIFAQLF